MTNIQAMRKERNLRQIDLAKKLNVKRSRIAAWETGRTSPRPKMLLQIAKLFKCRMEDLL